MVDYHTILSTLSSYLQYAISLTSHVKVRVCLTTDVCLIVCCTAWYSEYTMISFRTWLCSCWSVCRWVCPYPRLHVSASIHKRTIYATHDFA